MHRKIKNAIPSLFTLGNLLCGFLAIASGDPATVMILILAGATLDLFDGLVARILKATSEFGKQLDSLADIVTFGVAPAIAVYQLFEPDIFSLLLVSMIPLFSAIRLAKFNLDGEKTPYFKGLPTPANGIFFASIPFLEAQFGHINWYSYFLATGSPFEPIWLPAIIIVFSLLMVSPPKMFSLKSVFKKKGADRLFVAVLILLIVATAILFKWIAVPAGVVFYVLLSLIYHFLPTNRSSK